jgi:hypothetical protein
VAARLGDWQRNAMLDRAAWAMLQRGNTADAAPLAGLLGRLPRGPAHFIPPEQRDALRTVAQLGWLLPLLRWSLAVVWLVTAVVSVWVFPQAQSFELLARSGVPAELLAPALWGAAGLDLLLGLLTLAPLRSRRWLWAAQIGLILFYSAVIALRLPEFWLHPYAPMLKNLPMLALLVLLWTLEPRRDRR